jgi:hypothetical protein
MLEEHTLRTVDDIWTAVARMKNGVKNGEDVSE